MLVPFTSRAEPVTSWNRSSEVPRAAFSEPWATWISPPRFIWVDEVAARRSVLNRLALAVSPPRVRALAVARNSWAAVMLALSSSLTVPTLKPMDASCVCRAESFTVPAASPCQLTSDRLTVPSMAWPISEFRRVDDDVSRVTSDDPMVKPARGWIRPTASRDTVRGWEDTKGKRLRCTVDAVTRTTVAEPRLAGSEVKGPRTVGAHSTARACWPSVYGKPLRTALGLGRRGGVGGKGPHRVEGDHVRHQLDPPGVLGQGAEVDGEAGHDHGHDHAQRPQDEDGALLVPSPCDTVGNGPGQAPDRLEIDTSPAGIHDAWPALSAGQNPLLRLRTRVDPIDLSGPRLRRGRPRVRDTTSGRRLLGDASAAQRIPLATGRTSGCESPLPDPCPATGGAVLAGRGGLAT